MIVWLAFAAGIAVTGITFLLVRWWLRARAIAAVAARIAPVLIEPDEFFALLDLSGDQSHFLERHGPMLKNCEVLLRAETGRLDVSGYVGKPVASARWLRHADMLRAVTSAAEHWKSGARPKGGRFVFRFQEEIGEGYLRGGGALIKTRVAVVVIRDGIVVTAFPLLVEISAIEHQL